MVLVVAVDDEDDVCCVVACGGTRTEFNDGLIANSGMEIRIISNHITNTVHG